MGRSNGIERSKITQEIESSEYHKVTRGIIVFYDHSQQNIQGNSRERCVILRFRIHERKSLRIDEGQVLLND